MTLRGGGSSTTKRLAVLAAAVVTAAAMRGAFVDAAPGAPFALAGTWTLVAADRELPNGTRVRDYGRAPSGRLLVDDEGRYSLQIFEQERPAFVSGDKLAGSAAEYRGAVLGSSTHFGALHLDAAAGLLVFRIEDSSFPNWRGTEQRRRYELDGDLLTYRVPPRPDGSIPISVWRRLK